MTTKKGSGGSGRPPAPGRPQSPSAPPQPKRPQVRPVPGPKPVIRPVSARIDARPKPKAEPLPSVNPSEPDDDLTNVMARPGPAGRRNPAVPAPAARAPGRPVRPDIDVVPKHQRGGTDHTVVMPNAPARREHTGRGAEHSPVTTGKTPAMQPPATFPPRAAALPTFPPAAGPQTMPLAAPLRPAQQPSLAPTLDPATTRMLSQPPPANWTPSAPPIAGGRVAHPPPMGTPPPPNVRVQPSMRPAAPAVSAPAHFSVPPRAKPLVPGTRPGGALGLFLFAAPLAIATLVLIAIAFV